MRKYHYFESEALQWQQKLFTFSPYLLLGLVIGEFRDRILQNNVMMSLLKSKYGVITVEILQHP